MKRRRPTFIRLAWDERTVLSPAEFAIVISAIVLTLVTMLIVLFGIPSAASSNATQILGPERSDRAYCWYVSDPCSNQLPTK